MLTDLVERYVSIRRALGSKIDGPCRHLRAFARFAGARGETHVLAASAIEWARMSASPASRHARLRDVATFSRFLRAEDADHEVPENLFPALRLRSLPYIFKPEEILGLLEATERLRSSYPLRRQVYRTLIGLMTATGLRVSEALNLTLEDLRPDGVLHVRDTKFRKSRLVPMHPTVVDELDRYLLVRRRVPTDDRHVFLGGNHRRISACMVSYTFRRTLKLAGIAPVRERSPRLQDLRHTFATRALEQCSTQGQAVARHFVALATYLGHSDIASTYWYLEATPELMTEMARAAEEHVSRDRA